MVGPVPVGHGLPGNRPRQMDAYADERSEAWQESERADTFRERIEALEAVIGDLEELL